MLTQASNSRQVELLWNFIGIPLSVPTSITTPASVSCLNLRASVGRRMGPALMRSRTLMLASTRTATTSEAIRTRFTVPPGRQDT
jgi:hypothetical protein